MHSHDGYAPHSHEVRADHMGVKRTEEPAPWPWLAVKGLPATCPECSAQPPEWALTVYGGMLKVTCPKCWAHSLPIVAVQG